MHIRRINNPDRDQRHEPMTLSCDGGDFAYPVEARAKAVDEEPRLKQDKQQAA